jgi:hypothetical protein
MTICPKCDKKIEHVNTEGISVDPQGKAMKGISYLCPLCNCVLSVAIDPVALNSDILREVRDLREHVTRLISLRGS